MSSDQSPILFLDSGIGGLSVMHAAAKLMPHQQFLYTADYAGAPYGTKTEAEIASRVPALLGRLAERYKPSLIVIACNTACTIALSHVRAALNIPIVGTVPAIKPASFQSKSKVIGLLGTDATIRQPYVDRLENNHASDCIMLRYAAPELVDAAEAKMRGESVEQSVYDDAINGLLLQKHGTKIDNIILGCTHFPLLIDELSRSAPASVNFMHGADGISRQIEKLLILNGTPPAASGEPKHHFITSGQIGDIDAYKFSLDDYGFGEFSSI